MRTPAAIVLAALMACTSPSTSVAPADGTSVVSARFVREACRLPPS
jgi:hypothetical protein